MRFIKLIRLAKGFFVLFMIAALLTAFHQWTYSNVPLFTQYLVRTLLEQPGVAPGNVSVGTINLPSFLIAYFEKTPEAMEIVLRIALALLVLQFFRFSLRFVEMWAKGSLLERMAERLRIRLYGHIQDLNYEFHNKADTGDLIQRVTSDVETTTNFLAGRSLDIIHLFATLIFGAYQLILINPTMVWITLAIVPFVGVSSTIYFIKIEKIFDNIEKTESSMMTVIQESMSGARVVRDLLTKHSKYPKWIRRIELIRKHLKKRTEL
ncbi:MAG: ABC transporter transmembrane domain-containing protein, partial [Acholeplasmataceae bacterium]|nr:ABC transporter transmembrane domain-containing protein [Acholeplasmataceae bacterium]